MKNDTIKINLEVNTREFEEQLDGLRQRLVTFNGELPVAPPQTAPVAAIVATAAVAAGSTRPVSRRRLLFPWRRGA